MPRKGYKQTENHKRKVGKATSKFWRGRPKSETHKRNISKALKGNPKICGDRNVMRRPEVAAKMAKTLTGRTLSEEHRKKQSEAKLGKKSPIWKGGRRQYWRNLSIKAWEEYHGRKFPKGHVLHHKDKNYKNISPPNLILMPSTAYHSKWHWMIRKLVKRILKIQKKRRCI